MSLTQRRAEVAAAEAALASANQHSKHALRAARARVQLWWPWLLIGGSALAGGLLTGRSSSDSKPSTSGSLLRRVSQLGLALRLVDGLLPGASGRAEQRAAEATRPSSAAARPSEAAAAAVTNAQEAHAIDTRLAGNVDAAHR